MNKRSSFYPNGEFIPYQMPQDLDHQQVEVVVGTVVCFLKKECFVVFIGLRELEILMFVINGENDTSRDRYFSKSL